MKQLTLLTFFLFLLTICSQGQGNVGIGTSTPHSSAAVHINSSNKGLLVPRVDDFTTIISNPAKGLMVYDSSRGNFFYYTGTDWSQMLSSADAYWAKNGNTIVPLIAGSNIGLGTSNALARLQINHRNTTANPAILLLDSAAGTGSSIQFKKTGGNGSVFTIKGMITNNASNDSLLFLHNSNSLLTLRGNGRAGINNIPNPAATLQVGGGVKVDDTLHVGSDINIEGLVKINGDAGSAGQVLVSKGTGTNPGWEDIGGRTAGNVGFGTWGDCANTANISEYNPVAEAVAEMGSAFGYSTAIAGNYAFAGIPFDDVGSSTDQGSVNVYQFNGSNWVFLQKISDPTGTPNNYFGRSISASGNMVAIGAPKNGNGSVSIYQLSGGTWSFMQKITDATGAANDQFGHAVCLSGNYLIAGAPSDDVGSFSGAGSASIYQLSGGTWSLMQKITDATGEQGDNFGYSVAVSNNHAVIGAAYDDNTAASAGAGSLSMYQFNGSNWVFGAKTHGSAGSHLGWSISLSGNYLVAGAPSYSQNNKKGLINIYNFSNSSWSLQHVFSHASDIGVSVHISGNYMLAGNGYSDTTQVAVLYQRVGGVWQKMQTIHDPADANDQFGLSVALDGVTKRFMIGAPDGTYLFGSFVGGGPGSVKFGKIN